VDNIKTLDCNHSFHPPCVDTWINYQINSNIPPSCPLCRDIIPTEHVFENDHLPDLIPVYVATPTPVPINASNLRSDINRYIVDRYLYILKLLFNSINTDDIVRLTTIKENYINDNISRFHEHAQEHINITEPTILNNEQESYSLAMASNPPNIINWWMNKADTFNTNFNTQERSGCILYAGIIACRFADLD